MNPRITNFLTIDVEDYYQVAAFDRIVRTESWDSYQSRVEGNTIRVLDILDRYAVRATFFVLGWVAERHPGLVREIDRRGHEIGCHSYAHRKIYLMSVDEFRDDTRRAKTILEDIIGRPVTGYRAPSYSITRKSLWALQVLEELGFTYDSSIFPIRHDNYGIPDAPRFAYRLLDSRMTEYPMSTSLVCGCKVPVCGGGYFRLFPYWFTKAALARINRCERQPFIFYLHPWELDPDQPRLGGAGLLSRFRHYNNLEKTGRRLRALLSDFSFGPIPVPDNGGDGSL